MKVTLAERRECADALDDALAASGLSQDAFAATIGTSASRLSAYRTGKTIPSATLYLRALRRSQGLAAARQAGWMSAPQTSAAVRIALREDDSAWAFKMALQGRDHLRAILRGWPAAVAGWEAAPQSTDSDRWDALLAALSAHEFLERGLIPPPWTDQHSLAQPWLIQHPFLSDERVRAQTPEWLAEHRIYIPANDLETA